MNNIKTVLANPVTNLWLSYRIGDEDAGPFGFGKTSEESIADLNYNTEMANKQAEYEGAGTYREND